MKYSVIIGLSDNCCDIDRLVFVMKSIDEAMINAKTIRDLDYEIILSFMTNKESCPPYISNLARTIIVPYPLNGYFSNSIQYNFGIRAAEGEYIIQTDIDVIWRYDLLINVERILFEDPDAFIGCDFKFIHKEYSQYNDHIYKALVTGFVPDGWIKTQLADCRAGWFYGNLQIYKKKYIEEAQGYDERMRCWGEWDNDWNLRLREQVQAYILPQWSQYHLFHERRITNNYYDNFDKLQKQLHKFGRNDVRYKKNDENWGTVESKYFKHPHYEDYPE